MSTPLLVRRSASRRALVDELAQRYGGRPGLGALLSDLPGRAHRAPWARLLGHRVEQAWGWEAADRRTAQWWPQGVTTSGDATALGSTPAGLEGRRVAVVSWYAKPVPGPAGKDEKHGVRLTFLDLDSLRYRHVLLVRPVRREDGQVGLEPVTAHAGGIVWAGSWIHVAATGKGCVSAHLDDLLWLPEGEEDTAHGYRWVLPTRVDHRGGVEEPAPTSAQPGAEVEKLRWSFLSLAEGTQGPSLLVGEYGRGEKSTRVARFPLGPDGVPAGSPGDRRTTYASEVVETGVKGMQGVADVAGRLHVTTSHGPWGAGSLVTAQHGAGLAGATWRRTAAATPMGPEDLSWSLGRLWVPTEHPRRRWLVAVRPVG
ncbi:hypothetical protein INN71_15605 [Nocardioides sp. ChNu-153]|uniref:hypothetical protein n=1 Tax=Nocardioides sp. ChNu-153 TaxID=2779364 RepID=UPI002654D010|nr:hypothetical protein [Nocardioides sp. ChNu-153]MDN7122816.1 hypothetical protein [Nocardioides sp. ChNu-153]